MRTKSYLSLFRSSVAASFLLLATMSHAVTTLISPSRYGITQGVAFTLGNGGGGPGGNANFLFNWTDPNSTSFANIADPTLVLTLGQTYTFQRITLAHPFVIMNNTAAGFISGTDGDFFRTTTDPAVIAAAVLTPKADFTANPGTPGNTISWTPTQVGDFWYTCEVASHTGMTGQIIVVPEPSVIGLVLVGLAFAALGCRFSVRARKR